MEELDEHLEQLEENIATTLTVPTPICGGEILKHHEIFVLSSK